jgi:Flp pilus assembly protein TadD
MFGWYACCSMRLRHILGVLAVGALLLPVLSTAAPAPTTTGGTTTAPPAAPLPSLSNVIVPATVTARQGHVRFLVGLRTKTEARIIVRIVSVRTGKIVRTAKITGRHAPGRVWMSIAANTDRGNQLPAGRYRLQIYGVDANAKRSAIITRGIRLAFRAPRGVLHVYTVPAWPSIIAGISTVAGGQIVAGVGSGTPAALGGLQRGDVIHTVNGINVDARGAWFVAMRNVPANVDVPVEIDRAGVRQTLQIKLPPDWTLPPNYRAVLDETLATAPGVLAYKYASIREFLDRRDVTGARTSYNAWVAAEKSSAPGQLLSGAILSAEAQYLAAAGEFNQALTLDPTMAAASFQQGLNRTANKQNDRAITAFATARTLDPTDAISATFHAYALLGANNFTEALAAADVAVALDPRYEEARIARGIALIGLTRTAEGVADIKRGLLLLADPVRAEQIIASSLEPYTP